MKPKTERQRAKMLETARQYSTGTYIRRFVSPVFQRMARAEAAAMADGNSYAVVDGTVDRVPRKIGQCVCVTCGEVKRWDSGIKGMHTGHFLASRRNAILFEEANVAPQCSACNFYRSGEPQKFRLWMESVRPAEIERLEKLKTETRTFTREELVDMRIKYQERLNGAIISMGGKPKGGKP